MVLYVNTYVLTLRTYSTTQYVVCTSTYEREQCSYIRSTAAVPGINSMHPCFLRFLEYHTIHRRIPYTSKTMNYYQVGSPWCNRRLAEKIGCSDGDNGGIGSKGDREVRPATVVHTGHLPLLRTRAITEAGRDLQEHDEIRERLY